MKYNIYLLSKSKPTKLHLQKPLKNRQPLKIGPRKYYDFTVFIANVVFYGNQ